MSVFANERPILGSYYSVAQKTSNVAEPVSSFELVYLLLLLILNFNPENEQFWTCVFYPTATKCFLRTHHMGPKMFVLLMFV